MSNVSLVSIYDIVPRHFPDLPDQARQIKESEARLKLTELYFRSVGASSAKELGKVFGWRKAQLRAVLQQAEQAGWVRSGIMRESSSEELITLSELL